MKKTALSLASVLLLSAPFSLQAQEEVQGPYIGGKVSHYMLDRDRFISGDDDSTNAGINLGYRLDNPIAVELGYGADIGGGADMDAITFSTYYHFDRTDGWAPYLVGSLF